MGSWVRAWMSPWTGLTLRVFCQSSDWQWVKYWPKPSDDASTDV